MQDKAIWANTPRIDEVRRSQMYRRPSYGAAQRISAVRRCYDISSFQITICMVLTDILLFGYIPYIQEVYL